MKNQRFETYFRKHKDMVLRQILEKTGDYQAAQELCQNIFYKFYLNMHKVHPDMVKAWLIRCTKHAIIDYHRTMDNRKEIIVDFHDMDDGTVFADGNILAEATLEIYEEKKQNMELTGKILSEVKEVNEKWYEVLVMSCIDGMSYAEMAEELNMSTEALRARVHRARSYVRERFGGEYQDLYKD